MTYQMLEFKTHIVSIYKTITPLSLSIFLVAWALFSVGGILVVIRLQELQEDAEKQRILSQTRLQVLFVNARALEVVRSGIGARVGKRRRPEAATCPSGLLYKGSVVCVCVCLCVCVSKRNSAVPSPPYNLDSLYYRISIYTCMYIHICI